MRGSRSKKARRRDGDNNTSSNKNLPSIEPKPKVRGQQGYKSELPKTLPPAYGRRLSLYKYAEEESLLPTSGQRVDRDIYRHRVVPDKKSTAEQLTKIHEQVERVDKSNSLTRRTSLHRLHMRADFNRQAGAADRKAQAIGTTMFIADRSKFNRLLEIAPEKKADKKRRPKTRQKASRRGSMSRDLYAKVYSPDDNLDDALYQALEQGKKEQRRRAGSDETPPSMEKDAGDVLSLPSLTIAKGTNDGATEGENFQVSEQGAKLWDKAQGKTMKLAKGAGAFCNSSTSGQWAMHERWKKLLQAHYKMTDWHISFAADDSEQKPDWVSFLQDLAHGTYSNLHKSLEMFRRIAPWPVWYLDGISASDRRYKRIIGLRKKAKKAVEDGGTSADADADADVPVYDPKVMPFFGPCVLSYLGGERQLLRRVNTTWNKLLKFDTVEQCCATVRAESLAVKEEVAQLLLDTLHDAAKLKRAKAARQLAPTELNYVIDYKFGRSLMFFKIEHLMRGDELELLNTVLDSGMLPQLRVLKVSNIHNGTEYDLQQLIGFMGRERCKLRQLLLPKVLLTATVVKDWLHRPGIHEQPALHKESPSQRLQALDLSSNRLLTVGGNYLFKYAVCWMARLQTLRLRHCSLGGSVEMLTKVCIEMKALRLLRSLDLNNNFIEPDHFCALALGLRRGAMPSLTELDVSNNRAGPEGGKAMAKAFKSLAKLKLKDASTRVPALVHFDISSNDIKTAGGAAILHAFTKFSAESLTSFNISNNGIADKAAALCEAMEAGAFAKVVYMNLAQMQMYDEGIRRFMITWEECNLHQFVHLNLNNVSCGILGARSIAERLQKPECQPFEAMQVLQLYQPLVESTRTAFTKDLLRKIIVIGTERESAAFNGHEIRPRGTKPKVSDGHV